MIIPQYLAPGDKVGLVAPANKLDETNTLAGIAILESWRLKVIVGKNIFSASHQFAGTDAERIQDLQDMIHDHEIKAIFMARGGYGSTRIIDNIDFASLLVHPKWIIGYSDITAFHLHLYNLGIVSLHAPMPSLFQTTDEKSIEKLNKFLFGRWENIIAKNHPLNKTGTGNGRLIGGNLTIICHTIGTPSEIMTEGNLLFIEDVGEQLYHLDRMMVHMKRANLLSNLAGLIVGQFSDMEDKEISFGLNANEIINSHVSEFNYPVAFDFPIGHTSDNDAVPVGLKAHLIVDKAKSTLALD